MHTLALSSGGLHSAAHIGVIQYMKKINIKIDHYAGGSGGSIIAAMAVCGYSPGDMIDILSSQSIFSYDLNWPNFEDGFIKGEKIHKLLQGKAKGKVGDYPITIPITSLSTNITIPAPPEMPLADAVRASISIPGFFVPFYTSTDAYIDGGWIFKLPLRFLPKETIELTLSLTDGIPTNNAKDNVINLLTKCYDIITSVTSASDIQDAKDRYEKVNLLKLIIDKGNILTSFGLINYFVTVGYNTAKETLE